MNLLKLSFITIGLITLTTASYGASELQDALAGGTITQEARIVFINGNDLGTNAKNMQGADSDSNAGGFIYELNYLTKDFYGFQIGTGFQYGSDLDLHGEDGSDHDDERVSIKTVNMHRAYLKYNFQESNVVVGRQQIITPLLGNDDRVWGIRDSFDGVTLTLNNVVPDTVAKIMYINAWSKKNSGDTSTINAPISADVRFNGVYSLYLVNKSIKDVTLDGQYLMVDQDDDDYNGDVPSGTTGAYSQYYARAKYKFPIIYPVTIEGGYGSANFKKGAVSSSFAQAPSDERSTSIIGAKIESKISAVNVSLSYTAVDEKRNWPGTLGEGVDDLFYGSSPGAKDLYAGLTSTAVDARIMFKPIRTMLYAKIIYYTESDTGMDNSGKYMDGATSYTAVVRHNFGGILNGASATFIGAWVHHTSDRLNTDDEMDNKVLKINLEYKF